MSDVADRILLERFSALLDPTDVPDWLDVCGRVSAQPSSARELRRPRRLLLAVVLVCLVLGGASVAVAEAIGVLNIFDGEPAPQSVKEIMAQADQGAPPNLAPGVRASKTVKLLEADTSAGNVVLWIAPTEAGGFCLYVEREWLERRGGAGCLSGLERIDGPIAWALQGPGEHEASVVVLYGHVSPIVESLKLGFEDGDSFSIELSRGFFLIEIPGRHQSQGHRPERLIAYDRTNSQVAAVEIPESYGVFPG